MFSRARKWENQSTKQERYQIWAKEPIISRKEHISSFSENLKFRESILFTRYYCQVSQWEKLVRVDESLDPPPPPPPPPPAVTTAEKFCSAIWTYHHHASEQKKWLLVSADS